jgi:hypothetical protein
MMNNPSLIRVGLLVVLGVIGATTVGSITLSVAAVGISLENLNSLLKSREG